MNKAVVTSLNKDKAVEARKVPLFSKNGETTEEKRREEKRREEKLKTL